ncbi:M23 family metallopeptidase [Sphingomonas profundi]|uniref:M23 family metallopeptidase n=1 Tax=Alterirhizorhabdus profundi TaxID=2681549 RepID=UPI0012E7DB11|nr:M23 family metallopeptidase [Sphingomonas profundi]
MTRFGRWFAGIALLLVALFAAGLMLPRSPAPRSDTAGEATAKQPLALLVPSGLAMPVAGVRPEQLSDTFDDPRGEGGTRGHGALDIMAARGTPVVAAADGTIEKIFESELGGHTLYIRSPNGRTLYYYAHLDTYAPGVREGVDVRAGQRIGAVGSTGDASPEAPHLHFEIKRMAPGQPWHEGAPINPYPLLAGKAGGV